MIRSTMQFACAGAVLAAMAAMTATVPPSWAGDFSTAPLERVVLDAETRLSARIGVAMIDTESGETWQHRGDERFPTNSTFKTFLCAALLDAGAKGIVDPDRMITIR